MADEGFSSLSADERSRLDQLNAKEAAANGLTEEEIAKIAEEAEAAEAAFVKKYGGALLLGTLSCNALSAFTIITKYVTISYFLCISPSLTQHVVIL